MLEGYKTYLAAGAIFVLGGLKALGVIDEDLFQSVMAILTGAGLAALRNAVK